MEMIELVQALGSLAGIILTTCLCFHVKKDLKARR